MANAAGLGARVARGGGASTCVSPTVVRAALSPTVALLLLLVASLLSDRIVMFCCGATGCCPAHATWLLLAGVGACRS